MILDQNTTSVVVALFALLNTGLLVYQAIKLQAVHTTVDGARDAAVIAATAAGKAAVLADLNASRGMTDPPAIPPLR